MTRAAAGTGAPRLAAVFGAILAAWGLAGGGAAAAAEWQVDDAASRVAVAYEVNGVPGEARFTRFEGEGWFDPARPEDSELVLDFDIAAMDFGNAMATAFALGPDWFASEAFPDGRFRLSALTPAAGDGYVAEGTLTLKGVTRPVRVPLRLRLEEGLVRATGAVVIEPAAFGIGDGPSTMLVEMGRKATVRFELIARAVAAVAGAATR